MQRLTMPDDESRSIDPVQPATLLVTAKQVDELLERVAAGCPRREEWEARK